MLPHCTVAFFSCSHRKDQEIDDLAQKGLAAGCRAVVMTMGARGARTYARGMDDPVCCAARVGPVLDTMGAGDSFLTAFLVTAIQKFALAPQGSGEWMECMQAGTQFAFENCGFYGSILSLIHIFALIAGCFSACGTAAPQASAAESAAKADAVQKYLETGEITDQPVTLRWLHRFPSEEEAAYFQSCLLYTSDAADE